MRAPASLLVVLVAGCAVDAPPDEPSWQLDVMPILAANCVRCHGYPESGLAPPGLRLDSFASTLLANDQTISGAAASALDLWKRTRGGDAGLMLPMPLGRRLDDHEARVLRNWAGLVDGSMVAPRGPGRPDNREPSLILVEVDRAAGVITYDYELRDPDRDLVVGSVLGARLNADGQLGVGVIGDLVSGRGSFTWDTRSLPPGTYDVVARLDDGADIDGPDGDADYIEVGTGVTEVVAP